MEQKLLDIASLILDFGKIERKTLHQDGVRTESDTDHTVMIGILGASLASRLYPHLDRGLLTQFALVHDLVEVHAGDTDTLTGMNEETLLKKQEREARALEKIRHDFGSEFEWIHTTIEKYERLDTQEARFIKVLDKILPKLTVILNNAESIKKRNISKEEVKKTFDLQREKLKEIGYDMPELLALWEYYVEKELALI